MVMLPNVQTPTTTPDLTDVHIASEQPRKSAFFREHVFPRLSELDTTQRDGAMLDVLHGLHALCGEDDGFLASLRGLAFVPVRSGALRCAS